MSCSTRDENAEESDAAPAVHHLPSSLPMAPRELRAKTMIDCDAVMRQLWDYLDRELTPELMAEIEAHVLMCGRCSPHVEFEKSFMAVLRSAREDKVDTTDLRARVRESLREIGYSEPQ